MRYLIICLLLISFSGNAQIIEINQETGKYQSQGIIQVDSITENKIYNKVLQWIALNYKSSDVIQFKDKDEGKIILKGNFSSSLFGKQGWIRHTLTLEFKDYRFRYSYTDLSYYSSGSGEMKFERKMFSKKKIISSTEMDIKNSIQSISKFIMESDKNEDW